MNIEGQQEQDSFAAHSFKRLVEEIGWTRIILSVVLCVIVIAACIMAVPPSALMAILIGLFGSDSPYTSGWQIICWLCIPAGEVLFTALGAWWALWLWNKPRGEIPIVS